MNNLSFKFLILTVLGTGTVFGNENSFESVRLRIHNPSSLKDVSRKMTNDFENSFSQDPEKTVYSHSYANRLKGQTGTTAGIMKFLDSVEKCSGNCNYNEMSEKANTHAVSIDQALQNQADNDVMDSLVQAGFLETVAGHLAGNVSLGGMQGLAETGINTGLKVFESTLRSSRNGANGMNLVIRQHLAMKYLKEGKLEKEVGGSIYERIKNLSPEQQKEVNKHIMARTDHKVDYNSPVGDMLAANPDVGDRIMRMVIGSAILNNEAMTEETLQLIKTLGQRIEENKAQNMSAHEATQAAIASVEGDIQDLEVKLGNSIDENTKKLLAAHTQGEKSLEKSTAAITKILNDQNEERKQKELRIKLNGFYGQIDNRFAATGFATLGRIQNLIAKDHPQFAKGMDIATKSIQSIMQIKNSISVLQTAKSNLANSANLLKATGLGKTAMMQNGLGKAAGLVGMDIINISLTIAGFFMKSGPTFEQSVMDELQGIKDEIMKVRKDIYEVKEQIAELHEFSQEEFDAVRRRDFNYFNHVMDKFDEVHQLMDGQNQTLEEIVEKVNATKTFAKSNQLYLRSLSTMLVQLLEAGFERESLERYNLIQARIERSAEVPISDVTFVEIFSKIKTEIMTHSRDEVSIGPSMNQGSDLNPINILDRFKQRNFMTDDFMVEYAELTQQGSLQGNRKRLPNKKRVIAWVNLMGAFAKSNQERLTSIDMADLTEILTDLENVIAARVKVLQDDQGNFDNTFINNQMEEYKQAYFEMRNLVQNKFQEVRSGSQTSGEHNPISIGSTVSLGMQTITLPSKLLMHAIPQKIKTYMETNPLGLVVKPKIVWKAKAAWINRGQSSSDKVHDGLFFKTRANMLMNFRYNLTTIQTFQSPSVIIEGYLVDSTRNTKIISARFDGQKILSSQDVKLKQTTRKKLRLVTERTGSGSFRRTIQVPKYDPTFTPFAFNDMGIYGDLSRNPGSLATHKCIRGLTDQNWCQKAFQLLDAATFRRSSGRRKVEQLKAFINTQILKPKAYAQPDLNKMVLAMENQYLPVQNNGALIAAHSVRSTQPVENLTVQQATVGKWKISNVVDQGDWIADIKQDVSIESEKQFLTKLRKTINAFVSGSSAPQDLAGNDAEITEAMIKVESKKALLLGSLDSFLPEIHEEDGYQEIVSSIFQFNDLTDLDDDLFRVFAATTMNANFETPALIRPFHETMFADPFILLKFNIEKTSNRLKTVEDRKTKFGSLAAAVENFKAVLNNLSQ